ncbi:MULTISPECIES: hypothetical protein [Paraburkholderia]|nr:MULTISPECIES: hypothetical protein [Paraburkholderia]MBB3002865.1 hypothetical protein [Paraburkholderia tropica]MBB6320464.1 hypothetical protein [Paraburkholderia tropica]
MNDSDDRPRRQCTPILTKSFIAPKTGIVPGLPVLGANPQSVR